MASRSCSSCWLMLPAVCRKLEPRQQDELDHGEDDDGPDMLVTTAGLHPRDDLVDETAGQPDLRRGRDALQERGAGQGERSASGSSPRRAP